MLTPRKTCITISVIAISLIYVSYGIFGDATQSFTTRYTHLSAAIVAPFLLISVFAFIFSFKFPALINDWSDLRGKEYVLRPTFAAIGLLLVLLFILLTYSGLVATFSGRL